VAVGWRQDNGNRSNQESKFDFLATRQSMRLVKIFVIPPQFLPSKIKIVSTTDNQIYEVTANQFSPSADTTLVSEFEGNV